uniref:Cyclin N-terminal domain-containing protein n=1 Tax=Trichuris muris TaxID=70415 RepID=A0A5S6QTJ8_TRIMR
MAHCAHRADSVLLNVVRGVDRRRCRRCLVVVGPPIGRGYNLYCSAVEAAVRRPYAYVRPEKSIEKKISFRKANCIFDAVVANDHCRLSSFSEKSTIQLAITDGMRRTLTEWMYEVCEEERCDVEVFPLSVQYLDRFLSLEPIRVDQLQAVGTVCMFLASKLVEAQPISASQLVHYTDYSVTLADLLSWELLVLNKLDWDTCHLTAHTFIQHYLFRLRLPANTERRLRPQLRLMVALAATEYRFAVLPQSMIAASCLCASYVNVYPQPGSAESLALRLHQLTAIDSESILANTRDMLAFICELRQQYLDAKSSPTLGAASSQGYLDQQRMANRLAEYCRVVSERPPQSSYCAH